MKLCKDCEHLKKDLHPKTDALIDRIYKCKKYRTQVILRKPEDINTLECVEKEIN